MWVSLDQWMHCCTVNTQQNTDLCQQCQQTGWTLRATSSSVDQQCSDINLLLVYLTRPQTRRGYRLGNIHCAWCASFGCGLPPLLPGVAHTCVCRSCYSETVTMFCTISQCLHCNYNYSGTRKLSFHYLSLTNHVMHCAKCKQCLLTWQWNISSWALLLIEHSSCISWVTCNHLYQYVCYMRCVLKCYFTKTEFGKPLNDFKSHSRSSGMVFLRQITYSFLLVFHCNHASVMHHFQDIITCLCVMRIWRTWPRKTLNNEI